MQRHTQTHRRTHTNIHIHRHTYTDRETHTGGTKGENRRQLGEIGLTIVEKDEEEEY